MSSIHWVIPPATRHWLESAPQDRPVALLLRHSVRDELPPDDAGFSLPITEVGHQLAVELGELLRGRLRSLHASPFLRTMQTAERLREGANVALPVHEDRLLGDPGVFVVDERAGNTWATLGHEEVMRRLVADDTPPDGCADPTAAARFLAHHMLTSCAGVPGVHVFVTHDSLITATVARLTQRVLGPANWPWYLGTAAFWTQDDGVACVGYRERVTRLDEPLAGLREADALGLARREIAATVGLDCPAHFTLAGGAFKTLIHGQAPRDLDLWARTPADRALVREALLQRGATPLPSGPYTEAFAIAGRTVELSHKTAGYSLEERLARFDIGLSAIGVEHHPTDQWRVLVHPRAIQSFQSRSVLLLDELPNWRHSLATLVRLQRYAEELGYEVPESERLRIWDIFERQPTEQQRGMLERFVHSGRYDREVAQEAKRRAGLLEVDP